MTKKEREMRVCWWEKEQVCVCVWGTARPSGSPRPPGVFLLGGGGGGVLLAPADGHEMARNLLLELVDVKAKWGCLSFTPSLLPSFPFSCPWRHPFVPVRPNQFSSSFLTLLFLLFLLCCFYLKTRSPFFLSSLSTPPFLYQLSFNVFPILLCHYKHLYIVSLNDFNISPLLSRALSPCWAYYITHEPRLCCLQNSGKLSKITQRGGITLLNKQRPFIVIRCIRIAWSLVSYSNSGAAKPDHATFFGLCCWNMYRLWQKYFVVYVTSLPLAERWHTIHNHRKRNKKSENNMSCKKKKHIFNVGTVNYSNQKEPDN